MITIVLLLVLVAVGALLRRKKVIGDGLNAYISRYVYLLAVPAAVIYSLISRDSLDLWGYRTFLLINACAYMAVFMAIYGFMKARKFSRKTTGVIAYESTAPNTIFVGFPVVLALFGEGPFIYVVLLGVIVDTVLNFIRIFLINHYDKKSSASFDAKRLLLSVRTLVNPFSAALVVGLVLLRIDAELPTAALDALRYVGLSSSYAAMLLLGITIGTLKISREDREEISVIVLFKLIALPLLVLSLSLLVDVDQSAREVAVIVAALPAAVFSLIAATTLGLNVRLATSGILATTIMSVFSVPVWYFVLLTLR